MILLKVSDTIADIFYSLCQGLTWILNSLFSLLPNNPFPELNVPAEVTNVLSFANHFLPIQGFIIVISGWLLAIVGIIIYQLLFKFFKVIQS